MVDEKRADPDQEERMARAWEPVALPPDIPAPAGAYSPVVRAGSMLFVSGQVPVEPRTRELMGTDVTTQTKAVLANLERVLGYAGARMADVVAVTAYLASIEDWDAFDAVYRTTFQKPYPTRTTVSAGLHGFLVEISAVAVIPG
jgi:2-iminobutanoate/2-iminopropanoate deaminase